MSFVFLLLAESVPFLCSEPLSLQSHGQVSTEEHPCWLQPWWFCRWVPRTVLLVVLFCLLTPGFPGQVIVLYLGFPEVMAVDLAGLHFSEPLSQEWGHLPLLLLPKSYLCGDHTEEGGHVSAPSPLGLTASKHGMDSPLPFIDLWAIF